MSWEKFNRKFIAENLDDNGDLAPPWAAFPGYARSTIGWRMGSGETWMGAWHQWMRGNPTDEAWRRAYLSRHGPAPVTWADLVHRILHPGGGQPDTDALIASGLVGHDVAYGNWLLRQGQTISPPWGRQSPAKANRYSSRPYALWARWAVSQREAGTLSEWPALSEVPEAWQGVVSALKAGAAPADGPTVEQGFDLIAVEQVIHGTARPPWALGVSPDRFDDSVDIDTHYANAWALWTRYRFDDDETWRLYLRDHGAPPPAWAAVVEKHLRRPVR